MHVPRAKGTGASFVTNNNYNNCNYWADYAEASYAWRPQLAMYFNASTLRSTTRAHVQGAAPDLRNGWTDCAQIWCSDRDRLVRGRASQLRPNLQVRTCRVRFQISATAGPIALRFGTPIGIGWQGAVQKSVGNTRTQFRTCKAHPFARSRVTGSLTRAVLGGVFMPPPPGFRRYLKNGERCCFWHSLSYVFSA